MSTPAPSQAFSFLTMDDRNYLYPGDLISCGTYRTKAWIESATGDTFSQIVHWTDDRCTFALYQSHRFTLEVQNDNDTGNSAVYLKNNCWQTSEETAESSKTDQPLVLYDVNAGEIVQLELSVPHLKVTYDALGFAVDRLRTIPSIHPNIIDNLNRIMEDALMSALVDLFFQLARGAIVVRAGGTNRKIYDRIVVLYSRSGALQPPWYPYQKFKKCALRLATAIGELAPNELCMEQSDGPITRFESLIASI